MLSVLRAFLERAVRKGHARSRDRVGIDAKRNANDARLISADVSRVAIEAFPTDEELMIARHVQQVVAVQPAAQEA